MTMTLTESIKKTINDSSVGYSESSRVWRKALLTGLVDRLTEDEQRAFRDLLDEVRQDGYGDGRSDAEYQQD